MVERERSYRGISARAAIGYLENLGAKQVADDAVEAKAAGWRASVSEEKVDVGPSLKLTEVTVVFEGEAETLESVIEKFSQKAIRAGG